MTLLVVVAVEAEAEAVGRGAGDADIDLAVSGIGPARAAAATARTLAGHTAVLSLGIAGGFAGQAAVGDVVVADIVIAADLGVEEADGSFTPLDALGLGLTRLPAHTAGVSSRLERADLRVVVGPVLTVSTVTGTDARAASLARRHAAAAEAMEGYGVAVAAGGTPFAEVRAVSNLVGRRDRSGWDLPRALDVLSRVSAALLQDPPW